MQLGFTTGRWVENGGPNVGRCTHSHFLAKKKLAEMNWVQKAKEGQPFSPHTNSVHCLPSPESFNCNNSWVSLKQRTWPGGRWWRSSRFLAEQIGPRWLVGCSYPGTRQRWWAGHRQPTSPPCLGENSRGLRTEQRPWDTVHTWVDNHSQFKIKKVFQVRR